MVVRRFKAWDMLKGLWHEAFPQRPDIQTKWDNRSQKKKIEREELERKEAEGEEFEVTTKDIVHVQLPEEMKSFARRMVEKLSSHTENDENMKEFFREWKNVMDSSAELGKSVYGRLQNSDTKVVSQTLKIVETMIDRIPSEAIQEILRRDPDFDLDTFELEAQFIFERAYTAFLQGDLKYLSKVCSAEALGFFKSQILSRDERNAKAKYPYIMNVSPAIMEAGTIVDSRYPVFSFGIEFQELPVLIDKITGEVVEGNLGWLKSSKYGFLLLPHEEPDVEAVGHDWMILRVESRNETKQLN